MAKKEPLYPHLTRKQTTALPVFKGYNVDYTLRQFWTLGRGLDTIFFDSSEGQRLLDEYERSKFSGRSWQQIDSRGGYVFWRFREGPPKFNSFKYQVTKGKKPQGTGGYTDLDYLYRIKGVKRL